MNGDFGMPVSQTEADEVTASHLHNAMKDLEESRSYLRNAAKRLHLAGVGAPLHRNVCFLMDAVSAEEARLVDYLGGGEE